MSGSTFVYVGTFPRAYHRDPADLAFGVYVLRLDRVSGALTPVEMAPTPRPGWVALHPSGRYLYAMNEVREFAGRPGGAISAFAIDRESGRLSALNTRPTGASPCHGMVDRTGRYLFVPTFHGATVHVFPIEPDGRLGPARDDHRHKGSSVHPRRQTGPHPHSITLDPANRFALVPDLGTDRVVVYELDLERGRLVPHPERDARVAPGSGPRHLTFHPSAPFGYLVNEMAATVTVFAYDPTTGTPSEIQTVPTRAAGATGLRSAAAIAVHPSGRFLYCTNRSHGSSGEPPERGEDSIAWLAIDAATGRLTPCGRVRTQGEIPRAITIDREGARLYVASQARSIIEAFRIDAGSGEPAPTGQVTSTPVPACLQLALL